MSKECLNRAILVMIALMIIFILRGAIGFVFEGPGLMSNTGFVLAGFIAGWIAFLFIIKLDGIKTYENIFGEDYRDRYRNRKS